MSDFKTKLIFNCDLEAISDTVNLCVAEVEKHSEQLAADLGITTRIRWVITELLTNAIKHSGVDECVLTLFVDDEKVLFEKTDTGNQFQITEHNTNRLIGWPVEGRPLPGKLQVAHNGMESLWAEILTENKAAFFVTEVEEPTMPPLSQDTSEHFGLLILTKASDAFEYEYEADSKTNRFRCTFLVGLV
jgi:anti-sigma regulatory factor (Ser/Thr protein kinase)